MWTNLGTSLKVSLLNSPSSDNVILIGFMGSGKSIVGRQLAEALAYHFTDTDQLIVEAFGKPIHEIFDTHGEDFFRQLETKICSRLNDYSRTVISTGGGTIMSAENRKHLQDAGYVIYLSAPLDTLKKRLPLDGKRPLMRDPEAMAKRYLERQPWYDALANYSVDTSTKSINQVVDTIATQLNHLKQKATSWPRPSLFN